MDRVLSRQNPLVKRFRDVARGGLDGQILLDGEHLIAEALASAVMIDVAAVGERLARSALVERMQRDRTRVVLVSESVLRAMSPVQAPSGIVAIGRTRRMTVDEVMAGRPALVLMLHDVQDPGNVGALVRATEACGGTGVICSERTADPFGWKALRGSMGSALRLPLAADVRLADAIVKARAHGLRMFATTVRDGTLLPACDLRPPAAILLGSEGAGLPEEVVEMADVRITIPMRRPVESLNVAVAGALVLYEAARQRDRQSGDVAL